MSSKFSWNTVGGAKGSMDRRKHLAHIALDTAVIQNTTPFVPMVTGMLASSPLRASRLGTIVYDTTYAKGLYYNPKLNFTKTFHPLAGAFWFKRAKPLWIKNWQQIVENIIRSRR